MNIRKPIALSLIALTITAPGLASASSLYHAADGEVGVTTHPDHVQSTVSRDDVLRSVEIARKDGSLAALSRGGSLPIKATSCRIPDDHKDAYETGLAENRTSPS